MCGRGCGWQGGTDTPGVQAPGPCLRLTLEQKNQENTPRNVHQVTSNKSMKRDYHTELQALLKAIVGAGLREFL